MQQPWVLKNIAKLKDIENNPLATAWADRLTKALKSKRLRGRLYLTRIDEATGEAIQTTQLGDNFEYR